MIVYDATGIVPESVRAELGMVESPCPPTGSLPPEGWTGLWWYDRESSPTCPLTVCHYGAAWVQPGLEQVREEAKGLAAHRPGSRLGWISDVFNASQGFEGYEALELAGNAADRATRAMMNANRLPEVFSRFGLYGYVNPEMPASKYKSRLDKAVRSALWMTLRPVVFVTPWVVEAVPDHAGENVHEAYHRIAVGVARDHGADLCVWSHWGPEGLRKAATGDYSGSKATLDELRATDLWRVLLELPRG